MEEERPSEEMCRNMTTKRRYHSLVKAVRAKREEATRPKGDHDMATKNNFSLQDFGGDIVIQGPGLTQEIYEQILPKLAPHIRALVIGWKATAR